MHTGEYFSGKWHDFLAYIREEGAVPGIGPGIHENDIFLNYSINPKGKLSIIHVAYGPHTLPLRRSALKPTLRLVETPRKQETRILYLDKDLGEYIVSDSIAIHANIAVKEPLGKRFGLIRPSETWAFKIADCSTQKDRVPRLERKLREELGVIVKKSVYSR